ncbi:hypothetical protein AX17_003267 [Amanita inopinata Kibby_2008]|nr:hypothetical protein AX17_003267 [Amanita inopinata Kibby_2008]
MSTEILAATTKPVVSAMKYVLANIIKTLPLRVIDLLDYEKWGERFATALAAHDCVTTGIRDEEVTALVTGVELILLPHVKATWLEWATPLQKVHTKAKLLHETSVTVSLTMIPESLCTSLSQSSSPTVNAAAGPSDNQNCSPGKWHVKTNDS